MASAPEADETADGDNSAEVKADDSNTEDETTVHEKIDDEWVTLESASGDM